MNPRAGMALIRGLKGLYPCPICLISNDDQSNLSVIFTLRTQHDSKALVDDALESATAEAAEAILKTQSLRPVKVFKFYQILTCFYKTC